MQPTEQESAMATDLIDLAGHEQVVFCSDPDSGLRAIIALHNTSLGPGLGGTRFHPYSSTDQALADVLRLSRAMTNKNAIAGIHHGGGKAVIIGDPRRDKSPELLRAYGRFVESLGGRYVTACDVGTYAADMDVVAETTAGPRAARPSAGGWATPRSSPRSGSSRACAPPPSTCGASRRCADAGSPSPASARSGASSPTTSLRTAPTWSSPTSTPMPSRPSPSTHPGSSPSSDVAALVRERARRVCTRAPSAARSTTTPSTPSSARIVCGGANNQLVTEGDGGTADRLVLRGITYCPDFLVNAGGVIQVSDELLGFDFDRARERDGHLRAHPRGAARRPTSRQ